MGDIANRQPDSRHRSARNIWTTNHTKITTNHTKITTNHTKNHETTQKTPNHTKNHETTRNPFARFVFSFVVSFVVSFAVSFVVQPLLFHPLHPPHDLAEGHTGESPRDDIAGVMIAQVDAREGDQRGH